MQFLLTGERGPAFRERGFRLADSGLGREKGRAAALGLLVEFCGVESGEGLALFHLIVGIDQDFFGCAGEFATDDDLGGGRVITGGGDDEGDTAGFGLLRHIVVLQLRLLVPRHEIPTARADEGRADGDKEPFSRRARGATGDDGGEIV